MGRGIETPAVPSGFSTSDRRRVLYATLTPQWDRKRERAVIHRGVRWSSDRVESGVPTYRAFRVSARMPGPMELQPGSCGSRPLQSQGRSRQRRGRDALPHPRNGFPNRDGRQRWSRRRLCSIHVPVRCRLRNGTGFHSWRGRSETPDWPPRCCPRAEPPLPAA